MTTSNTPLTSMGSLRNTATVSILRQHPRVMYSGTGQALWSPLLQSAADKSPVVARISAIVVMFSVKFLHTLTSLHVTCKKKVKGAINRDFNL